MANEQIYEYGEYCEKCLGVENVGTFCEIPLCAVCWKDDDKSLQDWFAGEVKKALIESGIYEELPGGKFKKIET